MNYISIIHKCQPYTKVTILFNFKFGYFIYDFKTIDFLKEYESEYFENKKGITNLYKQVIPISTIIIFYLVSALKKYNCVYSMKF